MTKYHTVAVFVLSIAVIVGMTGYVRSATMIDLDTASGFAVMAGAAVSDTATASDVIGDVGLSPTGGSAITQLSCTDVEGTIYDTNGGYTGGHDANTDCLVTDATLLTATKADVSLAYNDAKDQPSDVAVTASTTDSFAATGYTLTPGVYTSGSTMGVPVSLTLDAEGDSDAVFIFQAGTTLNTVSGSTITLTNGAKASNVFWQVGSSATLGTGSTFEGTIMAAVSITDDGGSTINGRLLADADDTDADSTGAVTLNNTTITIPTTLNVVKEVVNDDGGTAVASDFTVHVEDGGVDVAGSPQPGEGAPGTAYELSPGTYTVSEDAFVGYNVTFGGDCAADGTVTLESGDSLTCTITNNDVAPQLTVNKIVINDDGGTNTISDFPLFLDGDSVTSGVATTTTVGAHTVSETTDPDYAETIGGDCAADGTITLAAGDVKTCTITNDDIATSSGGSAGASDITEPPVAPIIDVVKVPSPLALPDGPGTVEYTYTLSNTGTEPVGNITMVDNTCSPVAFISGDDNFNSVLEVDETWTYTCSTTLSETTTNTVTATGWANGVSATDNASATVVVGLPIVPPLINVTKVPDPLAFADGGGTVTYTNKVTNPGDVPLSDVRVADDKCGPVEFVSGDTNGDSMLDSDETWTYTCQSELSASTTNTVTAVGEANGLTATDTAITTVIVRAAVEEVPEEEPEDVVVPKLPDAGITPGENTKWYMMIPAGIFGALTLLYVVRKRKTS